MSAKVKFIGKGKVKVVIYVRVSTQEQAKEGYSIGEQIERLTKYCEAMGWVIVETYIDPGYSGGDTERPGLKKMIKDIADEEIDKVVVYKLDRLSRSQKDTLFLIEDVFLKNNTDFVSMNENFDTSTPFGRAMIGILAVFAQLEREQIKERMTMGKEARAKEGKWDGGAYVPIGYDYNDTADLLEVNAYEAMQIREAAELFLAGTPLKTIIRLFDEKGYKHKYGEWHPKTMRNVFRSKVYLGYIRHRDEWHKADHDPIFDEATHEKLVAKLDASLEQWKLLGVTPGTVSSYLGGLLQCKHCGGKFHKQEQSRRDKSKPVVWLYTCYSRSKKSKEMIKDPNCKNKRWKMLELDKIVFDEIRQLALDPKRIRAANNTDVEGNDKANKIALIEKEIEKIDTQISRFLDLYGIGRFTTEQLSSKTDPLNDVKAGLVKELNALNMEAGRLTTAEAVDIASTLDDALAHGTFDEVREIIESLIYYIEVDNEDVLIHWKLSK